MKTPTIEVIARGVLVSENHLLLANSSSGAYTYLPGGHVELGESVEEALNREWQEELGCNCEIQRFLGCVESRYVDHKEGHMHHEYSFVFLVSCKSLHFSKPLPKIEENLTFCWHSLEKLAMAKLRPRRLVDWLPIQLKVQLRNALVVDR